MQILMSEAARQRIEGRIDASGLDIVTIAPDGAFARDGQALDAASVHPAIFWMSLDLYKSGQLPDFFRHILRAPNVKWVQIFAAGLDHPAFRQIMAKGLRLTKSSAQSPAIADYVLCHALSLLHPLAERQRLQAAHSWSDLPFREIGSTRWLMLGFGTIGVEIAKRLQPFGAHLTVVRRNTAPEPLAADVRPSADLLTLLPDADVVVLACPLNPETKGIAGTEFFAAMKPGSLFINIGRGGLVDEAALRAGLDRNQPAQAVLDVFETEPLPADSWFWDHPKVSASAHTAGTGDGVLARGDDLFLENLRRYRNGEPLLHEAHPSEAGL